MDEGVTSFKLFMAYPGVFLVDDATIFRAMSAAGERGGLICMHAENGIVINEIIKRALAEGRTAPKYHALTRPTIAEAEGVHRAIATRRDGRVAGLHRPPLLRRRARTGARGARPRHSRLRRDLPAVPLPLIDDYGEGFEGAKYVMTPPLREKWNQDELWKGLKIDDLQVISTDHCPFCMKEQKELGRDDFSKIPNGAPGVEHRMSLIYNGGVVGGAHLAQPLRRADLDRRRQDVRPLPEAKERSPSAPTPTSSSSTPRRADHLAPRRTT